MKTFSTRQIVVGFISEHQEKVGKNGKTYYIYSIKSLIDKYTIRAISTVLVDYVDSKLYYVPLIISTKEDSPFVNYFYSSKVPLVPVMSSGKDLKTSSMYKAYSDFIK